MKNNQFIYTYLLILFVLTGCKKEEKSPDAYQELATDILFEDINVGRFQHLIPSEPFKVKLATFNVQKNGNDWSGFAVSNRNHRLYVTNAGAVDSTRFSVYTNIVHAGGNFLVAKTNDNNAFVRFDRPIQVDRVLVANTTQVWQTINYGQGNATLGFTFSPGTRALNVTAKDYVKVIATGYQNDVETAKVEFLLADRRSDALLRNFTIVDWMPMELSSLGKVDKILFQLDSSDKTAGKMNTPPYFCLDGFRFSEQL